MRVGSNSLVGLLLAACISSSSSQYLWGGEIRPVFITGHNSAVAGSVWNLLEYSHVYGLSQFANFNSYQASEGWFVDFGFGILRNVTTIEIKAYQPVESPKQMDIYAKESGVWVFKERHTIAAEFGNREGAEGLETLHIRNPFQTEEIRIKIVSTFNGAGSTIWWIKLFEPKSKYGHCGEVRTIGRGSGFEGQAAFFALAMTRSGRVLVSSEDPCCIKEFDLFNADHGACRPRGYQGYGVLNIGTQYDGSCGLESTCIQTCGTFTPLVGSCNGDLGCSANPTPASTTGLRWPKGVTVSSDGSFAIISSTSSYVIKYLNMSTQIVSQIAGSCGSSGFQDGSGNIARFRDPECVVVAPDNSRVLVCDYNSANAPAIRSIELTSGSYQVSTLLNQRTSRSIAMLDDGTALILDGGLVRKISDLTTPFQNMADLPIFAGGSTCCVDGRGTNAGFAGGYYSALAVSPDYSKVVLAEHGNGQIRVILLPNADVYTLVSSGTNGWDDAVPGATSAADFTGVHAAVVTPDGNTVLVANGNTPSIRAISLRGPNNAECGPCPPGFTGATGNCSLCAEGKYKRAIGSDACAVCPPGLAPINQATACGCSAGTTGPNAGPCLPCEPGSFKIASGSGACNECTSGTYSTSGSAICVSCPANADSPSGSTEASYCTCNVGYSGPDGDTCLGCAAGKYKNASGSHDCTDCSEKTFSTIVGMTSDSCTACPSGSSSLAGSAFQAACICNRGWTGPDGGPCTTCEAGKFKDTNGTIACTLCPADRYSNATTATSADNCMPCPSYSHSSAGSTLSGCLCSAGYFGNGPDYTLGVCIACAGGHFTPAAGETLACAKCLSGYYSAAKSASTACLKCAPGATSMQGSTSCECTPGFKDSLNGSFADCGYSEFRLQEALVVDFLRSESFKRPICVPNSFWPDNWVGSPSGGWWARVENREWDEDEMAYRIFLSVLDPAAQIQQQQQQQQTISIPSSTVQQIGPFRRKSSGRDLLTQVLDNKFQNSKLCVPLKDVEPLTSFPASSGTTSASPATQTRRNQAPEDSASASTRVSKSAVTVRETSVKSSVVARMFKRTRTLVANTVHAAKSLIRKSSVADTSSVSRTAAESSSSVFSATSASSDSNTSDIASDEM